MRGTLIACLLAAALAGWGGDGEGSQTIVADGSSS